MRKIREVLRLRLEADLSVRQISICTKVSVGSIQKLLKSAQALGLYLFTRTGLTASVLPGWDNLSSRCTP